MSEDPIVQDQRGNRFTLRAIDCPTCRASDTKTLGRRGGEHHRYQLGVETTIVQCRRCSLLFPCPFPFPLNVSSLYSDPDKYFQQHDQEKKISSNQRLIQKLRRYSPHSDKILDVGSGRGELLRAAKREGITRAVGIEISEEFAQYSRDKFGLEVLQTTIEQLAAQTEERFDAIFLNAVLEHAHDPNSMIESASRLLRPGGYLYIDIPNEPHLSALLMSTWERLRGRETVYYLSPTWSPFHVFGFNPKALSCLLQKHGLSLLELEIWASPKVHASSGYKDQLLSFVVTQINRAANWVGMASNMYAWARRS